MPTGVSMAGPSKTASTFVGDFPSTSSALVSLLRAQIPPRPSPTWWWWSLEGYPSTSTLASISCQLGSRCQPGVPPTGSPISLLSIIWKLYSKHLGHYLLNWLVTERIIGPRQIDFSTINHCRSLAFLANKYLKPKGGKLYTAFVDLKRAFDLVSIILLFLMPSPHLFFKGLLFVCMCVCLEDMIDFWQPLLGFWMFFREAMPASASCPWYSLEVSLQPTNPLPGLAVFSFWDLACLGYPRATSLSLILGVLTVICLGC